MAPTRLMRRLRIGSAIAMTALICGCPAAQMFTPTPPDEGTGQSEPGAAKTLYVSVAGDDSADGLTADTAFRTISRAVRSAAAGDAILVGSGTYVENVRIEGFGSPEAETVIRGGDPKPVLDGDRKLTAGLQCVQCTNMVFENLELRGYTDAAVLITFSDRITTRNLTVHDNGINAQLPEFEGYGIFADDSRNITIEDNEVFANGPNPQVLGKWLGTGIDTFGLTDSLIRNNDCHDNVGGGILVEDSINVLVEANTITANDLDATIEQWWDGAIWVDGGHDVTLIGNIVRDNIGPGIQISDEDNQSPFGYVLRDNVVTDNQYGLYVWNFGTTTLPDESILTLTDNQVTGNAVQDFWIVPFECPPDDPCE